MQQGWQRSWARHSWVVVWLLFGVFAASVDAASPPRGYQARACGFDLNHNGTQGEAADCGVLCSSGPNGTDGTVTLSGSTYTQVYVDCAAGNNANAGTRTLPKKSITSALTVTPASGASLAVCFTGTCTAATGETYPLAPKAGLTGTFTRLKSGSEAVDFQYPNKPAFLVGWDKNAPFGDYAPHDTNDISILDGTAGQNNLAINNAVNNAANLEYAHFTAQNFARSTYAGVTTNSPFSGFFNVVNSNTNHIWIHDLILTNILDGMQTANSIRVFPMSSGVGNQDYIAIENLQATNIGGYFARGWGNCAGGAPSCPGTTDTINWRFKNLTLAFRSVGVGTGDGVAGFKLWNFLNGVEVLDSSFDSGALTTWTPVNGDNFDVVGMAQCSRGWTVRNNYFKNWKSSLIIQPDAGSTFCQARTMDNIVIDANYFDMVDVSNNFEIGISGGPADNVTITNNVMRQVSSTGRFEAFIYGGSSSTGTWTIAGNTFYGYIPSGNIGQRVIHLLSGGPNIIVKDNIFQPLSGGPIVIDYAPTNYQSAGNVYTTTSGFTWSGSARTFAQWNTEHDVSSSKSCPPSYVNSAGGDLHLTSTDTCAKDAGVSLAGITSVDFDSDLRPQGSGWDIGADEYATSTGVLGDLDGNATVDALDLQHLVNVLLGLETNPKADLDGDGSATALDLQRLVNVLLGL